jgi:hypothetical protein
MSGSGDTVIFFDLKCALFKKEKRGRKGRKAPKRNSIIFLKSDPTNATTKLS